MADPILTPDELTRAARMLYGLAAQADEQGRVTIDLPVRTARRLGDAILATVNAVGRP